VIDDGYKSLLTEKNTDTNKRKNCWLQYSGIVFFTMYHELSNNEFKGLDDLDGLYPVGANPFQNVGIPFNHDHRYLFARTFINGMLNDYALKVPTSVSPMNYFKTNYPSTVMIDWFVYDPIDPCPGSSDISPCLDREWYDYAVRTVVSNPTSTNYKVAFATLYPFIEAAIDDMINTPTTDPTGGATSVLSANRCWRSQYQTKKATQEELAAWYPITNYPINDCPGGDQEKKFPKRKAFTFDTEVGKINVITWHNTYPPTDKKNDPTRECSKVETIEQAYIRHLNKLYINPATFAQGNKGPFDISKLRMGISGTTVHTHALRVEPGGAKTWDTFIFVKYDDGQTTEPINQSEYIPNNVNPLPETCP